MSLGSGSEAAFLDGADLVHTVSESDAAKRKKPQVLPMDTSWVSTYNKFKELLDNPETSIDQIITQFFTEYEARLLVPSDLPVLKALQTVNTHRFKKLLHDRFRGITPDSPTKLTMLYFGLPVEPINLASNTLKKSTETTDDGAPEHVDHTLLHTSTTHKQHNWDMEMFEKENLASPFRTAALESAVSNGFLEPSNIPRLRGGGNDDEFLDDSRADGSLEENPDLSDTSESDSDPDLWDQELAPDYVPRIRRNVDLDSAGEWINMYGYQGVVPFIPGNWKTFAVAIRRLLSADLGYSHEFSVVRLDNDCKYATEVWDELPLRRGSSTMEYVTKTVNKEMAKYDKVLSSFFVTLRGEKAPEQLCPSPQQLNVDVIQVQQAPIAVDPKNQSALQSRCYISIPNINGSIVSSEDILSCGTFSYNSALRTALDVLVGGYEGGFPHAFYGLYKAKSGSRVTTVGYGLSDFRPSDIKSLLSSADGDIIHLKERPLTPNEVAIVLPTMNDSRMEAVVKQNGSAKFETAIPLIRKVVNLYFGRNAGAISRVRLLDGDAVLNDETCQLVNQASIAIQEDNSEDSIARVNEFLKRLSKSGGRFVLLYPEWKRETYICMKSMADPGKEHHVPMPGIYSSVKEFRGRVAELMKLAGFEPQRIRQVADGEAPISIQPRVIMTREASNGSFEMGFPSSYYIVEPDASDGRWVSIRARIPSHAATVTILDKGAWSWASQIPKANVWGPRYGRIAEERKRQARHAKERDKLTKRNEITKKYIPKAPWEERQPVQTSGKVQQQANIPPMPHLRREYESPNVIAERQKSWATQPSIFENNNLRTWPANNNIRIPVNAPPIEPLLTTGSRLPMVTTAIMTPSEQAGLQRAFWNMRNIALNRTMKCSYENCTFTYRLDDKEAIKAHLNVKHVAQKCPWCDEPLFEYWSPAQRSKHLRHKHKAGLLEALGATQAAINHHAGSGKISIPLHRVSNRPKRETLAMISSGKGSKEAISHRSINQPLQGFCDRCGRNRETYTSEPERRYHDRNCCPGIHKGANCTFCTICGGYVWQTVQDARKSQKSDGALSTCGHNVESPTGLHCARCGFDASGLKIDEQDRHRSNCKGYGSDSGQFCIYCGIRFIKHDDQEDWNKNMIHMEMCHRNAPKARVVGLPLPHTDAFRQQQNKLRTQANEARPGAMSPEEGEGNNDNERSKPKAREHIPVEKSDTSITWRDQPTVIPGRKAKLNVPAGAITSGNKPITNSQIYQQIVPNILRRPPRPQLPASNLNSLVRPPIGAPIPSTDSRGTEASEGKDTRRDNIADQASRNNKSKTPVTEEPTRRQTPAEIQTDILDDENDGDDDDDGDEVSTEESTETPGGSRGRKRRRDENVDRDGEYEDDGDDSSSSDEEEELEDENGNVIPRRPRRKKSNRRGTSPDWNQILGPEDPSFVPPSDHYCSRCFRKAPKSNAKARVKSPLGWKKEMELHHDINHSCRIRRGIGSIRNLPNRSGWIPLSEMPKPISNLRIRFLRKYPQYGRTLYPLHEPNANGSYWRSDPNNDENTAWWDMPWPPWRGQAPFPDGWTAPDEPDATASAGRSRQQFILRPVHDPTYRQRNSDEESVDVLAGDEPPSTKKKRTGQTQQPQQQPANPLPLAARITNPDGTPSVIPNSTGQTPGSGQRARGPGKTRLSRRKRQKTNHGDDAGQ